MKKIRIILATSFVFIAILFCLSCVRTNNEVSGLMTTSSMATQSSSSSSFVEPVEDTPQPIPATPTPTPLPELLYEGDFEFFLEDGEATITGYYGFSCNEVPSELGGCPVVHIGNDAFYYSDISCQTLPGTVKTIGDRAFSYCNRLIKMSLPGSVTSVGEEAFYQSNNIESITLSKSITYMGPRAFSNCSFSKVIIPEGLKFIGDEAFAYNNFDEKTMKRIEIPSTVEHIGFDAFKQVHEDYAIEVIIASQNKFYQMLNGNLMSKDGTVLYSGPYCAYSDEFDTDGSRFLGPYYVPDGVTRIEESAFTTTQATEFIIPSSVESIGEAAFDDDFIFMRTGIITFLGESEKRFSYKDQFLSADGLTFFGMCNYEINIPASILENVNRIGKLAFSWDEYKSIEIPNNIKTIGEKAFRFSGIKEIVIPDSVFEIGAGVFEYCRSLRSVDLSSNITIIPDRAFMSCERLEKITIPYGIESIGHDSFSGCDSITEANLPESVTSIGVGAFAVCSSLHSVILPKSIISIGRDAFSSCALESITIPGSVQYIGPEAFSSLDSLNSIILEEGLQRIGMCSFANCYQVTAVQIPNSVQIIAPGAFSNCKSLNTIQIPGSVKTIGKLAFWKCESLSEVIIEDGVEQLGEYIFRGCDQLKKVTIPASVSNIGKDAFGDDLYGEYSNFTIYTTKDSYASQYANEHGIPCVID